MALEKYQKRNTDTMFNIIVELIYDYQVDIFLCGEEIKNDKFIFDIISREASVLNMIPRKGGIDLNRLF